MNTQIKKENDTEQLRRVKKSWKLSVLDSSLFQGQSLFLLLDSGGESDVLYKKYPLFAEASLTCQLKRLVYKLTLNREM